MDYTNLQVIGADVDGGGLNKEAKWFNVKRWLGERVSGSYKEKMDILRTQDKAIHEWTKDLNKIVSLMNKYLKQSKMVELGYLLDTLNRRLVQIGIFGKEVQDITEQAKKEFDTQHDLKSLQRQFGKEAGLFDGIGREWFSNRLLGQKFRKERQQNLQKVINTAIKVVDHVNKILDKMSDARVDGDIGQYTEYLNQIAHTQNSFFNFYKPIYDQYLKTYVDQAVEEAKKEDVVVPENIIPNRDHPGRQTIKEPIPQTTDPTAQIEEQQVQQMETTQEPEIPSLEAPKPEVAPFSRKPIPNTPPMRLPSEEYQGVFPPQQSIPSAPTEPEDEEPAELMNQEPEEVDESDEKLRVASFLVQLEKLAHRDINQAVDYLLCYSAQIEDTDPQTSMKLLAIAEGFIDG